MREHLLEKLRLRKEIVLCEQDPIHFMLNYVNCKHSTHGTIPFHPHDYQVEYIEALTKGNTIVHAARQAGSSLTTTLYLFWEGFFQQKKQVLAANRVDLAVDNLQHIRHAYMTMPSWLRDYNPMVVNDKMRIEFANGSYFTAITATEHSFRGMNIDTLFIDNFSRIQHQEDVLMAALPIVSYPDSKGIIVSSGDTSEVFDDMFSDSANGLGTFTAIKIVPDY